VGVLAFSAVVRCSGSPALGRNVKPVDTLSTGGPT